MANFEEYVRNELPQRPVLLTKERTGFQGDPNDSGAPDIVKKAPKGSLYINDDDFGLWKKNGPSASAWEQLGTGGGGGGGGPPLSNATPNAIAAAGDAGASTSASRGDHTHAHGNQAGGSTHPAATTSVAGFQSAADKTKLDGIAVGATANSISNATPPAIAAAGAVGASTDLARADHTHAHGSQAGGTTHANATQSVAGFQSAADKTKQDSFDTGTKIYALAATLLADSTQPDGLAGYAQDTDVFYDRINGAWVLRAGATLSNTNPAALGTASAGVATSVSRSDHVHAHGSQAGGTTHPDATTSVSGFQSAADKTKLDGIAASATNTPLASTTPAAIAAAGSVGVGTTAARADHVHAHGSQAGGSTHPDATQSVAGYMSTADKTKLDAFDTGTKIFSTETALLADAPPDGTSAYAQDTDKFYDRISSTWQERGVGGGGGGGPPLSDADPEDVGTADSGVSSFASRADHVHSHGNQAGGSTHANATTSVAGFQSAADKTKLDGIAASAAAVTASAPANVTKATAAVGVATDAARADHKHDVSTAAPSANLTPATTNAEGSASALARSDHSHALTMASSSSDVSTSASAQGSAANFARGDHTHQLTFAALNTVISGANAAVSFNGQRVSGADPVSAGDFATRSFVENLVNGRALRPALRTAATTNLALSGLSAVNGVTPQAGDRIGAFGQSSPAANGPYIAAAGAWTRATDDIRDTATWYISEGNLEGTSWSVMTNDPITVGVTSLSIQQTGGPGAILAGDGLLLTGNVIAIVAADASITLAADSIRVSLATVAPQAVTKATAAIGTSLESARADHKHDVSTAAAAALTLASTAAEGSATSLARSDHSHSISANTAPANVTKATAAVGTSNDVARADHKHDISTAAAAALNLASTAAEGAATTLARSDHSHSISAATAPSDVTKSATVVGVSNDVARADHKHDISTAAAAALNLASTAAEGSATSLARSDHSHSIAANVAPINVTKATAVIGTSNDVARADHKHDVTTAAPGATGVSTASGEGSSTSLARADHTHQSNTAPVAVTRATAAIGTSGEPARADHKHDISTAAPGANSLGTTAADGSATTLARSDHTHQANTAPVNVTKATAAIGTSGEPARADHKHDISTAAASGLNAASTNTEGSATSVARSDHTHAIALLPQTYAAEATLLAATPQDGTWAYAEDTDKYYARKAGAWTELDFTGGGATAVEVVTRQVFQAESLDDADSNWPTTTGVPGTQSSPTEPSVLCASFRGGANSDAKGGKFTVPQNVAYLDLEFLIQPASAPGTTNNKVQYQLRVWPLEDNSTTQDLNLDIFTIANDTAFHRYANTRITLGAGGGQLDVDPGVIYGYQIVRRPSITNNMAETALLAEYIPTWVYTTSISGGGGGGVSDGDKGDIVVSGGGTIWDIDAGVVGTTELANDAVTHAKYQNIATDRLLGRVSASSGDVEEIPVTDFVQGIFDDTDAATVRGTIGAEAALTFDAPLSRTTNTISVVDASTSVKGAVQLATSVQTTAGLAVQASDTRLSDSRAPNGSAGGMLTGTYPNPDLNTNARRRTLAVTINGGGSAIPAKSVAAMLSVPANMTITGWEILGDVSGSIVVDVKKCDYAGFPTASSIAGTEKPTLSSAQKNTDTNLTTWTDVTLQAGEILIFTTEATPATVTLVLVRLICTLDQS